MTFARYEDRPTGPGRGDSRDRTGPTLWIVLHTSEQTGTETASSADSLVAFIGTPATTDNVASYNCVVDVDKVFRMMDDNRRAHHAAGANDKGLGLCIPGTRFQTIDEWFDDITGQFLEQAARCIADWHVKYQIPLKTIEPADLRADRAGICDHNDVRIAFGQTTHTDIGDHRDAVLAWLIRRAGELVGKPGVTVPWPGGVTTMFRACKLNTTDGDATNASWWFGNGTKSWHWPSGISDSVEQELVLAEGLVDFKSRKVVHDWDGVGVITSSRRRDQYVGRPAE